jgi:hypothetical protein
VELLGQVGGFHLVPALTAVHWWQGRKLCNTKINEDGETTSAVLLQRRIVAGNESF